MIYKKSKESEEQDSETDSGKEWEQEKDEAKSIKEMVKTIKDMSILLRITKKICAKSNMKDQIEKDYITIELDKDERNCIENIIGSED